MPMAVLNAISIFLSEFSRSKALKSDSPSEKETDKYFFRQIVLGVSYKVIGKFKYQNSKLKIITRLEF
jgi:hypothetical protein